MAMSRFKDHLHPARIAKAVVADFADYVSGNSLTLAGQTLALGGTNALGEAQP